MNVLADEGVDGPIVRRLRQDGHKVLYVAELAVGISDPEVLNLANEADCVLLTADKDFGELIFRQRRLTKGVLLMRLAGLSLARKAEIVAAVIKEHGVILPYGFSVINANTFRTRRSLS